jgi:hypothetical protein
MMHKLIAFILAIVFLACGKKNSAIAPQLSLSSSEEPFTADGGTSGVNVAPDCRPLP